MSVKEQRQGQRWFCLFSAHFIVIIPLQSILKRTFVGGVIHTP